MEWTKRLERYHASNRKLYGAILQAVPEWLRTSIFHDHHGNGASALEYLHNTFDANYANDNAAHVARLRELITSTPKPILMKMIYAYNTTQ